MPISVRRASVAATLTALVLTTAPAAHAAGDHATHRGGLTPRTHFRMLPDGSSGARSDGEGIPNVDSVKATIARYYGDRGNGIANKRHSPYITQMSRIEKKWLTWLKAHKPKAGQKKALVFDTDDTTLMTYDMEVHAMHFNFDTVLQNTYVQEQRFPATPGMVRLVNHAQRWGYTIFGVTGRNDDQKAATLANLAKVGYRGFTADRFFTKWTGTGSSQQPSYIQCATSKCSTVEFKALTRRHIQNDLGYPVVANFGDQWSDLQGGYARRYVKLPNPTYYLPSTNLPGVVQPKLAPRNRFTMKPGGASGAKPDGEGIPNIDSVKATVKAYYGDTGTGTANTSASPYLTQLQRIEKRETAYLQRACAVGVRRHTKPALVLDTDDTTLWTYDLEVGLMKFVFDPALQDQWVQGQKFAAVPGMVSLANAAQQAGCTVIGITGRSASQKAASLANLAKVGYTGFTAANYYTKPAGFKGSTVAYKSSRRHHVQRQGYTIVDNIGDQFSDLKGGFSKRTVKLPNPTYYLP
ncbi:hypothetical protein D9V37_01620 [Nocardioides mangrovicus]|uniref:Acid phosphatase n=1 Tax=Nocardioides mangrovicus TaxID=2478913 RepID=A0A3L8P7G7_9ACTN|nr:HAD family acid phosphatase [Nocardioides mangrovicus]RLV50693.1 hypothetical protein D9V37_01620 [Nocardioides mangrovicus]